MANVAFSELNLNALNNTNTIEINGVEIEIKQYISIEEKSNLIANILMDSLDENYANPIKVEMLLNLEIIYNYTNLEFSDEEKSDPAKLYDILEENGVIEKVVSSLPESEYQCIVIWTDEVIKSFYSYQNSVLGIVQRLKNELEDFNTESNELLESIKDPNNVTFLKDVVTKLG